MPNKDLTKLLSQEWHSLPDAEKDRYKNEYFARMRQYQKDMEPFRRRNVPTEQSLSGSRPPAAGRQAPSISTILPRHNCIPIAPAPILPRTTVQAPVGAFSPVDDDFSTLSSLSGGGDEQRGTEALAQLQENYERALRDHNADPS